MDSRKLLKNKILHAWKLMPEIGPNRMSHSHQSSCLKFLRDHFAFSAWGAEVGQDFPFWGRLVTSKQWIGAKTEILEH